MEINPRTDKALEFLQLFRPDGPWVLSAATPEREKMSTKTFHSNQLEALEKWIDSHQGKRNIYFTVNSVARDMDIKPKKTDISSMDWLHIDLDPRVGEDPIREKERALRLLREFNPPPTIIVDSGGGVQGFWELRDSVALDGTEEMASEYEGYNQQLELLLGGDHCFNVDRIMRLPGTINIPSEVKKRKGRVPTLAALLDCNLEQRCDLVQFTRAPKVQSKEPEGVSGGGERVKISGDLKPIYVDDLDKMGLHITSNTRVLIVQGDDPDDPTKYSSRSEALFAVCCALVRVGADDDTIAGVITNRDNGISASVLDKPRPMKYATKQIQSAREEAENPWLRKLNTLHAVISDIGGKCRIISEVMDAALKRPRISYQSFDDFRNRYRHIKVEVGVDKDNKAVTKPAGHWWIDNPARRQFETIVFSPGLEMPDSYNLWKGFSCEAIPGDCTLFLQHVRENVCGDNEERYKYLLGWMARAVQHPDCPGEVAIVMRGRMGTGKSFFAKVFGSLWGRHFLQVSDPKHLVGSFNAHLRDCVVLFGDEAFYAGDKKHESVLKMLITEEHITIEAKGVDAVAAPNFTHILLASNNNWVVPAGSDERRFLVLDVGDGKMQNHDYFKSISNQLESGGREALLHYLMTYSIADFNVRSVPKTGALQDQKLLSYSSEEQWWFEKLEEGRVFHTQDRWEREVPKHSLQDDYVLFMQRLGVMRRVSSTILGKFLGRVCPGGVPRSYQRLAEVKTIGNYGEEIRVQRRVYFYELPTLEECRAWWDANHGGPFTWSQPLETGEQPTLPRASETAVFE